MPLIGNLHTAQRIAGAERSFVAYVREATGCSEEAALKVLDLYLSERFMKLDAVMGTWRVKHGACLDREVLQRAVAEAPGLLEKKRAAKPRTAKRRR